MNDIPTIQVLGHHSHNNDDSVLVANDVAKSPTTTSSDDEYIGTFEGPEKTLEIYFNPGVGAENGLRCLTREQLDAICTKAKCTILNHISSRYIDAYLLSESSLFVYSHRLIMKTCGTTTLLRCLSTILEYADALGMEMFWLCYSRKNLMFPDEQQFPHSSFGDEIKYIKSHQYFRKRLDGAGHILGPITSDHWFLYVADHTETCSKQVLLPPPVTSTEAITLNMMMFDMDEAVAEHFFIKNTSSASEMTAKSGICDLVPGFAVDDYAFTPCGYSMNAVLHDAYSTIHITPEKECSYCSFETNSYYKSYNPLIRNVLNVFKPKRVVLTMFIDKSALENLSENPVESAVFLIPGMEECYARSSCSSTVVEKEVVCLMAVYSLTMNAGKNITNALHSYRKVAGEV